MSESILNFRPVSRGSAKIIIGLAGVSGSGKTYSALQLAFGLAQGRADKIGFIDTESGRGSLYESIFDTSTQKNPYHIADLTPPYSPSRYTQALQQAADAGYDVLVVDSMSHEWEGEGGCDDIARTALLKGKRMADWLSAKREHHRFMRSLLAIPCHLVLCFRAREKTSFKDPANPVSLGIQPICEKNVMFEVTVSFLIEDGGQKRTPLKVIPSFFSFLNGMGYLTSEHGAKMRAWFGGGDPLERSKRMLQLAAASGTESLKIAWNALSASDKKSLESFKNGLKDLSAHADSDQLIPESTPEEEPA